MTSLGPNLPVLADLEQASVELQAAFEGGDAQARKRVEAIVPWLATIPPKLFTLDNARLALAREYDFDHWGQLRQYSQETNAPRSQRASHLVRAAVSQEIALAERLLQTDPTLAEHDIYTAAVSGHLESAQRLIGENPLAAKLAGGPGDRTPLSYLCFSRFLARDGEQQRNMLEIARLLLDAGADPNAYYMVNADPNARQTCLYGAAGINNVAELTRMLLEAGADPNDAAPGLGPESLYHASEFQELECLRLILEADPHTDKVSYCMGRMLDFENPQGVQLYLQHGADPNFKTPWGEHQTRLHGAIVRRRSADVIQMLVNGGANLKMRVESGRTPYAWAVRWGHAKAAELLQRHGAHEHEASDVDRFLCACFNADEPSARALLIKHPDIIKDLTPAEHGSLPQAAYEGNLPAVRLMVELGFSIEAKGDFGTAINQAAWRGNFEVIEFLISRGANLETLNNFQGTALDCCVFGASNCEDDTAGRVRGIRRPHAGQYVKSVEALIAAGADVRRVSPFPSGHREIDDLLRRHGRAEAKSGSE